jgi:hypothetical protein
MIFSTMGWLVGKDDRMAGKRSLEDAGESSVIEPKPKKPRNGFRLPAPDHLPDGPWRRKGWFDGCGYNIRPIDVC